VVWRQRAPAGGIPQVQAAAIPAGGVPGPAEVIGNTLDPKHGNPQLAMNANGDALIVWSRNDGSGQCGGPAGCVRTQARYRSASGTWQPPLTQPPQTLSPAGQHANHPQVGIDTSGDAVAVWERFDGSTDCEGGVCRRIQAGARSASDVVQVQTLSGAGQNAYLPQVAVDPDGAALVVWQRYDGSTGCPGGEPGWLRIP